MPCKVLLDVLVYLISGYLFQI